MFWSIAGFSLPTEQQRPLYRNTSHEFSKDSGNNMQNVEMKELELLHSQVLNWEWEQFEKVLGWSKVLYPVVTGEQDEVSHEINS